MRQKSTGRWRERHWKSKGSTGDGKKSAGRVREVPGDGEKGAGRVREVPGSRKNHRSEKAPWSRRKPHGPEKTMDRKSSMGQKKPYGQKQAPWAGGKHAKQVLMYRTCQEQSRTANAEVWRICSISTALGKKTRYPALRRGLWSYIVHIPRKEKSSKTEQYSKMRMNGHILPLHTHFYVLRYAQRVLEGRRHGTGWSCWRNRRISASI